MRLVFIDESGLGRNCVTEIEQQKYFVLSAVILPADRYPELCANLRADAKKMGIKSTRPLGRGFEVKAKSIAGGTGPIGSKEKLRNGIRELMLGAPRRIESGTALVVVVDRKGLGDQYVKPASPQILAHQYLFERIEWRLKEFDDHAICIWDQNKKEEDETLEFAADLLHEGSDILGSQGLYTFQMDHISEVATGRSENSIGLQIADYFATMTYSYFKQGNPPNSGWWQTLRSSLARKNGKLLGVGLKVVP